MGMGVNEVRGTAGTATMGSLEDCLEEKARVDAMSLLGLLPSHRSDKNGVSEDCSPGEEEQNTLCVLGREGLHPAPPSSPPSSLGEDASSAREPRILMSYPAHSCPPTPRPQSMMGAHWGAGGAGGMWVALWGSQETWIPASALFPSMSAARGFPLWASVARPIN